MAEPSQPVTSIQARVAAEHARRQTEEAESWAFAAIGGQVQALWVEFFDRFREDEREFEAAEHLALAADLQARIDALKGVQPDGRTCLEMLGLLRVLVAGRLDDLHGRIDELSQGSRQYQRQAGAQELRSSHLKDEFERCRTAISQEYLRRGILPAEFPDIDNLHDRLAHLFAAIELPATARMPTYGADPVIAELEKLIASNDPSALSNFPQWMKGSAAKILEVIAERNRYRRLLSHHGMLPTAPLP